MTDSTKPNRFGTPAATTPTPATTEGAPANGTVLDTQEGQVSEVKTGTESSVDFDPSTNTDPANSDHGTPAAATAASGTTAVSAADAALGVTPTLDDVTLTKPIDEPPLTQPMTTPELLLQGTDLDTGMTTGTQGSMSPQQLQALKTLGDLTKAHEGHTPAVGEGTEFQGPDGYYSVMQGWVMSGGSKREARSVGGRFYFDPADLDEEAIKTLDKLVEAGAATKQGGNADSN